MQSVTSKESNVKTISNDLNTLLQKIDCDNQEILKQFERQKNCFFDIKNKLEDLMKKISNNQKDITEEDLQKILCNGEILNNMKKLAFLTEEKIKIFSEIKSILDFTTLTNLEKDDKLNPQQSLIRKRKRGRPKNSSEDFTRGADDFFPPVKRSAVTTQGKDEQLYPSSLSEPKKPKRNRKPHKYTTTPVVMQRYLEHNPQVDSKWCEESSECQIGTKTETKEPDEMNKKTEDELVASIRPKLDKVCNIPYVIQNFHKYAHIRTLYFANYDMTKHPPFFNCHSLVNDINITEDRYKYVKIVLIRKSAEKMQNAITSILNFYKEYIMRKDTVGNTMIKGELQCEFTKIKNYFTNGNKALQKIQIVQFEVHLFKCDLYLDYSNIDKTNMSETEIKNYNEIGRQINMLREIKNNVNI